MEANPPMKPPDDELVVMIPKLSFWQRVKVSVSSLWRLVVLRKEN